MASLVKYVIEKLGKENFHFFSMHCLARTKFLSLFEKINSFLLQIVTKGQLISGRNFGGIKSLKNPTKFLTDFCPIKLGQKSVKNLVCFLGDLKTPKIHSKINWPLALTIECKFCLIKVVFEWVYNWISSQYKVYTIKGLFG